MGRAAADTLGTPDSVGNIEGSPAMQPWQEVSMTVCVIMAHAEAGHIQTLNLFAEQGLCLTGGGYRSLWPACLFGGSAAPAGLVGG